MPNSESRLFQFNTSPVRTMTIDGEPWFVAKDVCDVLQHTNTAVALLALEDFEKGIREVYTLGGTQSMAGFEKGMYIIHTLGTRSGKGTRNVGTLC